MYILPSRSRPSNIERFFKAYHATGATAPGMLLLDDDDPQMKQYTRLRFPENWSILICRATRGDLSKVMNNFYAAYPDLPWYGMMADDCVPVTPEWDAKLIEEAGADYIAYPDDSINGPDNCCMPVIGANAVKRIGFLALPGAKRLYHDNAWHDFGTKHGLLRYRPDIIIEHWHFSTGKAKRDDVYKKPSAAADKAVYQAWKATL